MTVQEAIAAAECVLPGQAAPEGEIDPRSQAIIGIGEFVETEPEAVWSFGARWRASPDEDLRMAIATCLLEHLLERHFQLFIRRVERAARSDGRFGDMGCRCWKLGERESLDRSERFDRWIASIRQGED